MTDHVQPGQADATYEVVTAFGSAEVGRGRPVAWRGFRVFPAVSTDASETRTRAKRALNAIGTKPFDYRRDTLFDYPTVIAGKLGRTDWESYNSMACVHIPDCNLKCWHCYNDAWRGTQGIAVESKTAAEVVGHFLEQWDLDRKNGVSTRVLRITGGEPFLRPGFIRECAVRLAQAAREKNEQFFLWTETNLLPIIRALGDQGDETRQCLKVLAEHKEMTAVHPCCHGIDARSGVVNCGPGGKVLSPESTMEALRLLVNEGVDIYPTIHANAVRAELLSDFFAQLQTVHPNLPLRFALIELELGYEAARDRLSECVDRAPSPELRSRYAALWEWNRLMEYTYGMSYGVMPRHLVPIQSGSDLRVNRGQPPACSEPVQPLIAELNACVLKSAKTNNYRQHILRILGLPPGSVADAEYDLGWVGQDFAEFAKVYPAYFTGLQSCLLYFEEDESPEAKHMFLPLREATLLEADVQGDTVRGGTVRVRYRLGKWYDAGGISDDELRDALFGFYGAGNLPPTGAQYLALGSPLGNLPDAEPSSVARWSALARRLASRGKLRTCAFVLLEEVVGAEMDKAYSQTRWRAKSDSDITLRLRWLVPEAPAAAHILRIESSNTDLCTIVGPSSIALTKYGQGEVTVHCGRVKQKTTVSLEVYCDPDATCGSQFTLPLEIQPGSMLKETGVGLGVDLSSGAAAGAIGILLFLWQQSIAGASDDIQVNSAAMELKLLPICGPVALFGLGFAALCRRLDRRSQ